MESCSNNRKYKNIGYRKMFFETKMSWIILIAHFRLLSTSCRTFNSSDFINDTIFKDYLTKRCKCMHTHIQLHTSTGGILSYFLHFFVADLWQIPDNGSSLLFFEIIMLPLNSDLFLYFVSTRICLFNIIVKCLKMCLGSKFPEFPTSKVKAWKFWM